MTIILNRTKFFFYRLVTLFIPGIKHFILKSEMLRYFKKNNLTYWTNPQKDVFQLNYQGNANNVIQVSLTLQRTTNLMSIDTQFYALKEHQLSEAAILCVHLNTLITNGYLGISFQDRTVHYFHSMAQSDWILSPQGIEETIRIGVQIPLDVISCFNNVLLEGEDPVVAVGLLINNITSQRQNQH